MTLEELQEQLIIIDSSLIINRMIKIEYKIGNRDLLFNWINSLAQLSLEEKNSFISQL